MTTTEEKTTDKVYASPVTKEFLDGLRDLLDRLHEQTGFRYDVEMKSPCIEADPVDGWRRVHEGPQIKFAVTITDMNRSDEFEIAKYSNGRHVTLPIVAFMTSKTECDEWYPEGSIPGSEAF